MNNRYIRVRAVDPSAKEQRIVWGEDGGYDDDRGLWCDAAGHRLRAGAGDRSIVWDVAVETSAGSDMNEAN